LDLTVDLQRLGTYDFALDLQALPIVARSVAVGDPEEVSEGRIVVASWLAAKDTDDKVPHKWTAKEFQVGSALCSWLIVLNSPATPVF
jgi:hypothetical protein